MLALLFAIVIAGQVPQGPPPPPQPVLAPRAAAPFDPTGYWASAVTEDWQWRFVTPAKGDFIAVPLNTEGDKLAKAWDPDADVRNGNQCKPFGAAAVFRLPTRVHITWQDDSTLKMDFDLGTQSRIVYFDKSKQPGERSWQGHAIGQWIDVPPPQPPRGGTADDPSARAQAGRGADPAPAENRGGRGGRGAAPNQIGGLKVVTTNIRAEYLRMNGVPVSEKAVITDYIDRVPGPGGAEWLIVKTVVDDPTYMSQPYITSSQFKREADGSKWNPTPCELLPRVNQPAPLGR
jgi:hypothetical protein